MKKQYPMPKTNENLFTLEGFQYGTSLDLNMVYFHIRLNKNVSNLCTIILYLVKYFYKRLPMVVSNSPYIFQHKMNDLFNRLEFVRA